MERRVNQLLARASDACGFGSGAGSGGGGAGAGSGFGVAGVAGSSSATHAAACAPRDFERGPPVLCWLSDPLRPEASSAVVDARVEEQSGAVDVAELRRVDE